jgi:hypothetical protein
MCAGSWATYARTVPSHRRVLVQQRHLLRRVLHAGLLPVDQPGARPVDDDVPHVDVAVAQGGGGRAQRRGRALHELVQRRQADVDVLPGAVARLSVTASVTAWATLSR